MTIPDSLANEKLLTWLGWTFHQIDVDGSPDVAILPPDVAFTGENVFTYAGITPPHHFHPTTGLSHCFAALAKLNKDRYLFAHLIQLKMGWHCRIWEEHNNQPSVVMFDKSPNHAIVFAILRVVMPEVFAD